MPAAYKTIAAKNATSQKFYLAVVDETGAEHPEFGKMELALADIRAFVAGNTPLVDSTDMNTVKFRELKTCDDAGSRYYVVVPCSGGYTKP